MLPTMNDIKPRILDLLDIEGIEGEKFLEGASWYWKREKEHLVLTPQAADEAKTYRYSIGMCVLETKEDILHWMMHLSRKEWAAKEILNSFCEVALGELK